MDMIQCSVPLKKDLNLKFQSNIGNQRNGNINILTGNPNNKMGFNNTDYEMIMAGTLT